MYALCFTIILTKITATKNEVAHSYQRKRGLYIVTFIFAATICLCRRQGCYRDNNAAQYHYTYITLIYL